MPRYEYAKSPMATAIGLVIGEIPQDSKYPPAFCRRASFDLGTCADAGGAEFMVHGSNLHSITRHHTTVAINIVPFATIRDVSRDYIGFVVHFYGFHLMQLYGILTVSRAASKLRKTWNFTDF